MEGVVALGSALAESDREARFAAFAATHRDRALRLAWRLVGGDGAAAEDVTQDAFAKAYRGLAGFRDEAQLSTWFYRILVRQAYSHLRWRRVRERFGGEVPEEPPDTRAAPLPDPALRRRIADALAALPKAQRSAFLLVHLEGFTVNEAAEIMGRAPGTVKSHLHRALTALRRRLDGVLESSKSEEPPDAE
jgi:RNA polymerase sigma factor (sigma-70 family)